MKYIISAAAFYFAGHSFYAAHSKEIFTFYVLGVISVALGVASLFIKKD